MRAGARAIHYRLLYTAKNLGKWVKHFIKNLEEVSEYIKNTHTTHVDLFPSQIQEMTGDTNFGVVIVDFNSSDIDVKAELARSKLTQYAQHTLTSPLTSTLPTPLLVLLPLLLQSSCYFTTVPGFSQDPGTQHGSHVH